MTVSRISDQISVVLAEVSTAAVAPGIKIGSIVWDADTYPLDPKPVLSANVKKSGAGSGYIRVYDSTNAQELALVEVTGTSYAIISQSLANYILTGRAVIEIWIYGAGGATMYVDCASILACWVS